MNKKFFTLLVAFLATISFGAFAQLAPDNGSTGKVGSYASNKTYLLKATVGAQSGYLGIDDAGNGLVFSTTIPGSYSGSQKFLWSVKTNKASDGNPATIEYTNASNGIALALNSSAAKNPTEGNSNILGGDVAKWVTSDGKITPPDVTANAFQILYAIKADGTQVFALEVANPAAATSAVNIVVFADASSATGSAAAVKIAPQNITGQAELTVNDLNTQFGKTGEFVQTPGSNPGIGNIMATKDNFFGLTFVNKENTEASPFTHSLQARAVERWETQYGTEDTKFFQDLLNSIPAAYISMYPKGTADAKDIEAVRDEDAEWYTLYSRDDDAYLVVDTSYIKGTQQAGNARIFVKTDKLYNSKNETKYRLPDSYLFKLKYDAGSNSLVVVSKAYVKESTPNTATTTNNAEYYSGDNTTPYQHDPANAYNTNPAIYGSRWVNTYTISGGDLVTGTTDMYDGTTYGAGQILSYAELASTVAYTFGKESDYYLKLELSTPSDYHLTRVTTGAYLLKVTGSKDATRVGKYLKKNLIGGSEFITKERRQDFQEMPSAQWVVETTGSSNYTRVSIHNREFSTEFMLNNEATPYFGTGPTYGTSTSNEFFFLGGDTIAWEKVNRPMDKKLGYKFVPEDDYELNRYEFRFLHDLQMDRPINTLNEKDSAIWVDVNDNAIKFQLEKVADNTYGYTYNDKQLAKLERSVYRMKVYDSSNFEMENRYVAYSAKDKKYYLQESVVGASEFLLKANNFVSESEDADKNYYILLEANTTEGFDLVKLKSLTVDGSNNPVTYTYVFEKTGLQNNLLMNGAFADNNVIGYKTTEKDENGLDVDVWMPREFDMNDADEAQELADIIAEGTAAGILLVEVPLSNAGTATNTSLIKVQGGSYASSKVAVDNNSLSLINGVIYDNTWGEVNNSAFKVKYDDKRIYRHLGDVEGEEDNINIVKFFRVNSDTSQENREYLYEDANSKYSTGVNGPDDATRVSQINFLGVEGKGMNTNSAMKTRYFSGDVMPQYLISVDEEVIAPVDDIPCPIHGMDCIHAIKGSDGYITGRFLVNLIDSVSHYGATTEAGQKFLWEKKYTRLAFVDGILTNDSVLHITSSALAADKNAYDLKVNAHNPVLFQFRLLDKESNDFLFESESWNKGAFDGGIAPSSKQGGWVKIQNGVPVIISSDDEAYNQAEIFNLEVTTDNPTSNEGISEGKFEVTAGTGVVTIKGAAGKQVVVANILGKVVANVTLGSDYETISVPAGVVVVSVDGEATKALVK